MKWVDAHNYEEVVTRHKMVFTLEPIRKHVAQRLGGIRRGRPSFGKCVWVLETAHHFGTSIPKRKVWYGATRAEGRWSPGGVGGSGAWAAFPKLTGLQA